jgi:replicative DNA helicase
MLYYPSTKNCIKKEPTQDMQLTQVTKTPGKAASHPFINPFYNLHDLIADINKTVPNFSTGYPSLDALWKIPTEALTIIAGRPSHGKTTLLLNLFLNLIQDNLQSSFLFCSYEITKKQLLLNILSSLCTTEPDVVKTYLLKASILSPMPVIDHAKYKLSGFIENKRLAIIDNHLYIDELIEFITQFKQEYSLHAVFIDYIQKIKIKGRYQNRQVELQKISEQLLEVALKLSIPIILGAQFNREVSAKEDMDESKLREAGDIEQDAHSVLGIWNASKAQNCSNSQPILDIVILKNRTGSTGGHIELQFDGATFTLKDFPNKTIKAKPRIIAENSY